jgi:hypothetical protein
MLELQRDAWGRVVTRDRGVAVLILAVGVGLCTWIAFNTYWTRVTLWSPLRGEAATNPYYSVERLVHALGMRSRKIHSLRVLPAATDVLLVTDLYGDVAHTPFASLQHWVEGGGRLVVTSNVVWSTPALQTWSGIAPAHQDPAPRPAQRKRAMPPVAAKGAAQATLLDADGSTDCHPLSVQLHGRATGEDLSICAPVTVFGFASKRVPDWALTSERGMQLLRVALGHGSVTVIGPALFFNPRVFLRGDDARALIEGTQLRRGEQLVIFSASQAEPLVAMLWRLAAPAIVCFGLATLLLIVRHLPRFGPGMPEPTAARRSLAEQLRANARFAWRTGNLRPLRAAVLRSLDRDAMRHIPGYGSLDTRQRAAEIARRAGIDAGALNAALTGDAAGTPHVQRAAITLLEQARRGLSPPSPSSLSRQQGIA